MIGAYLRRGLVAGLVAGLAFGLFVAFVAGPMVAVTETVSHDEGGVGTDHDEGTVADHHDGAGDDRHQEGGGAGDDAAHRGPSFLGTAVDVGAGIAWGALAGLVTFGVVHYFLEPAIPGGPGVRSFLLAGAGFLTVSGVPWLLVPPRPGVAGSALDPLSAAVAYAVAMAAAALACLGAASAYRALSGRVPRPAAALGAAGPLLAVVAAGTLAGPLTGDPAMPPETLSAYQGVVVAGQVGFWMLLAGSHALLIARETRRRKRGAVRGFDQPSGPAAGDR